MVGGLTHPRTFKPLPLLHLVGWERLFLATFVRQDSSITLALVRLSIEACQIIDSAWKYSAEQKDSMAPADHWKRAQLDDPFWDSQRVGAWAPHVEPINALVDRLTATKDSVQLPYAAPWHGGIQAPVLCVLNDAGEQARVAEFLCIRTPDRTADRLRHLMTEYEIQPQDVCFWNGYPWPRETKKNLLPEEALEGGQALLEMLALMKDLKVLLLLGRKARDSADAVLPKLLAAHPDLQIIRSLHPLGAKSTVQRQSQKLLWAELAPLIDQAK